MASAVTFSTVPAALAVTITPESRATRLSMPVATYGASVFTNGTACRCMLDPMRARLASSCSRNGIKEVEIETSWRGDISTKSISLGSIRMNSPRRRAYT